MIGHQAHAGFFGPEQAHGGWSPKRRPGGVFAHTAIRLLEQAQQKGWLQTAHTSDNFLAAPREATMGSPTL